MNVEVKHLLRDAREAEGHAKHKARRPAVTGRLLRSGGTSEDQLTTMSS
jgi:hypothetical protein